MAVSPVTARAHAFVADLSTPVLDSADHHHLSRVLRLPPGALLTVGDGHGRWRPCELGSGPDLTIAGDVVADPRPTPAITICFALVKGERPELVVQKLTELGVDRIVPFAAARSVVRWDAAKAARQVERLNQIARQAAMQCRRTWLPEVAPLVDFAAVAALDGAARTDLDGDPPSLDLPVLLVGPEGGWDDRERAAGLPTVRLGQHVLRAETAAITAGAILTALRAHLVAGDNQRSRRGVQDRPHTS
ncbi:MAG TPA: RsmE family RNA methyltransferase [Acidimicrobiales bacterium]